MFAYRLISQLSFYDFLLKPSFCPQCRYALYWYDLIPLFSWLYLKGSCRKCKRSISWLYPAIELLTAVSMMLLFILSPIHYFFSYFIFFSALIVSIRTDAQALVVSSYMTLYLVPIGIALSYFEYLPIHPIDVLLGATIGYLFLWAFAHIYFALTKKVGIGEGDYDLLAFIGSFLGLQGMWISLTVGSMAGAVCGIIALLLLHKSRETKIPFGPFLALTAMGYTLIMLY